VNKQQTRLVPKLRFPEFREVEGWTYGQLDGALLSISNGIALEQSAEATGYKVTRIETISAGTIDLEKVGLVKTSQDISAYKLNIGDILLSNINSVAHIGKSVFIDRDYGLYHGMNLLRLDVNRTKNEPKFIFYAINIEGIRTSLRERANKAVNQASINQTELGKTNVALPEITEQKKIADCLSSLDELIAAQARKVEALKTHKKGLMQQLFPREGETQPRLRFPEFQNAGDWICDSLGKIFETSSGGTPSRTEKAYWNGNVPWITTSLVDFGLITGAEEFLTAEGLKNSSAKIFPTGTVLVAMYGQGKTRGKVALLGFKAATNQACAAILPRRGIYPYFVFLNLAARYEEIREMSNRGGQENLSQGLIQEIRFAFPPDDNEQRKIATCLCRLDELVTAEAQKLESLNTHKNGLMQQLFPSLREEK
jgi:type I restriction enzyme, S subunit